MGFRHHLDSSTPLDRTAADWAEFYYREATRRNRPATRRDRSKRHDAGKGGADALSEEDAAYLRDMISMARETSDAAEDSALEEGATYEGTVKEIVGFGAFVEILPGRKGLLHVSEIDHGHVGAEEVTDYFKVGERIKVKLLEQCEDSKLRLTRKPFIDPKSRWSRAAQKYSAGDTVVRKVRSIADFGAFVNLMPGVTALIHVSEMDDASYVSKHPSEMVSAGQHVEAEVLSISAAAEKASLRLKRVVGESKEKTSARRTSRPARRNEPAMRELLMIDGSNVCYWRDKNQASLNVLLTLLLELVRRGDEFRCVFDANIPYKLGNEDSEDSERIFRKLVQGLSQLRVVTGGIVADDVLLSFADEEDLRVITNDRFRKGEDQERRERYPWVVANESERLVKGEVYWNRLKVLDLDIRARVGTDTQGMADELVRRLG